MGNRSKELTKNTFIITLGRVSTQFISFLLLPLYTALLTKEEYGIVDLITTLAQLLIPVISVMVDQGVFRYLLNCETSEDKKKTISSAFYLLTITSITSCFIYFIISLFVHNQYKHWLLLILIVTAFSNLFLQVARGLKHTSDYALGSFVCSASTIVLNVLYIAFLHMGAVGMLAATFTGNAICCLFLFIKLRIGKYISISSVDKETAKNELKYSIPLVPNQLSLWVMNSSDRLIVAFFLGTAANGILAVSHKFPAIFMTFFNIFQLAWHETGAIHYFDEDRDQFFTDLVKRMLSIFSTLCMGIIIALPLVFDLFVNKSFNEAYYNIPIYLVAFLFNVIIGLLGVVYVATKNTTEIAKTTILAAVINIIVHLVLINVIGLYAASISTLVGYGVTMIYRIIDTKKYLKIKYNVKQFVGIGIVVVFCSFIYYLNNKVMSIIILPIFLIVAYLLNRETINGVIKTIDQKIEGKINKKLFIAIILTIILAIVTVAGIYVYRKVASAPKEVQIEYKEQIKEVEANGIVRFSDFRSADFTCTGLAYDSKDNSFWIGDYGAMNPNEQTVPRIIEVDNSLSSVIRTVDLSDVLDSSANLQGVAYDSKADCLWLAVGDSVVAINKKGSIVGTIELGKYTEYRSNGIGYDNSDDSLWILCATQYLLHLSKNGSILSEFIFNYSNQDHIFIDDDFLYITVGADYQGTNNYVCKVSKQDGRNVTLYRVMNAYALEGICIKDDKLMITNDGLYHSDLHRCSYISEYDFAEFR